MKIFANRSQLDVATVLMLIGEETLWRAIWSRMRGQHWHWSHAVFAVSPGWAPLSGSVFTTLISSHWAPNLILTRTPNECSDDSLMLTNLDSGATHAAKNTMLQNIWDSWRFGPRAVMSVRDNTSGFDITRQVGVVDLDLDQLDLIKRRAILIQAICLVAQLTIAFASLSFHTSPELLILLTVALAGQILLFIAISPRHATQKKVVRDHRACAVLLHRGFDSSEVLLIRTTRLSGNLISLEEYCWDLQHVRNSADVAKVFSAGFSFLIFIFEIILISWMSEQSKTIYLIIGSLGLVANIIDAALQPNWNKAYALAFSGNPFCAPPRSSLMAAVGVLLAARFPAAEAAAQCLYPDNGRFRKTLSDLSEALNPILCDNCCFIISGKENTSQGHQCLEPNNSSCATLLASAATLHPSKQISDALATVSYLVSDQTGKTPHRKLQTAWKTALRGGTNH